MAEAKTVTKLSPRETAIVIGRAIKGRDEATLVTTMSSQSPEEMHAISHAYKGEYIRDLTLDISNDIKDNKLLQSALMALSMNPVDYDATLVREGVRGWGTDEHLLTEILCTRTPEQLSHILARYHVLYGRNMLEDIKDDTSGHLRKVYIALLSDRRDRVGNVEEDVEELFKAGEDKWGTDEAKFIDIICHSTRAHCEDIYRAYAVKHKKALDYIIHDEMGGLVVASTGHAGRALAMLVSPLPIVFSTKILKYVKPFNPKHVEDLIRIIVTQRCKNLKLAGAHFQGTTGTLMSELIAQGEGLQPMCQSLLVAILKAEGC